MMKTISSSAGTAAFLAMLFVAGPVFAANGGAVMHYSGTTHADTHATSTRPIQSATDTATSSDDGRGIGSPMGGTKDKHVSKAKTQALCLKTAVLKRDAALHAAQVMLKKAEKGDDAATSTHPVVGTSTEAVNVKLAYKNAVKAAQAAFAADRKMCLKK